MNLSKILKNCPVGVKLYSPIYGEMEFSGIEINSESIHCRTNKGTPHYFYPDGRYELEGECMLFPSKKQRNWDNFMIPFRDGDVIIKAEPIPGAKCCNIAIFSNYNANALNKMTVHCQVNGNNEFKSRMSVGHENWRLANPKEIQHFITRMHEANYDFKDGKLIALPVFEVGNTITNGTYTFKVSRIDDMYYYEEVSSTHSRIRIEDQDKWKIKKFDVCSLKPYDKVLIKSEGCWYPSLVSYVNSSGNVYIIDCSSLADYVIPFAGNEHLIGKFDDPDPYYITWRE